jgi:serine/threonine protein kinase
MHRSTRNLYMVCEFCNGGSLKEYLKTQKYLTEPEALTFFIVRLLSIAANIRELPIFE